MDLNLAGRHALVCGASEGIGRATARELAALGADVTAMARRASSVTLAPSSASSWAAARPMPSEAPQTRACRPVRLRSMRKVQDGT